MSKGRKVGTGKVFVGGQVMTTQRYMDTAVAALENNGNNWMTTDQIVSWGYANGMCEHKNSRRLATTHPMWKIMSMMSSGKNKEVTFRYNAKGLLEYKLRNPKHIMVNGVLYENTNN